MGARVPSGDEAGLEAGPSQKVRAESERAGRAVATATQIQCAHADSAKSPS
jgi:hypothetical protein